MEQPVTLIPDTIKFSETKVIEGKKREIYFSNDEAEAFKFARENNGHHYLFMPGSWRILIPSKSEF